jgi:hypothetical protein
MAEEQKKLQSLSDDYQKLQDGTNPVSNPWLPAFNCPK